MGDVEAKHAGRLQSPQPLPGQGRAARRSWAFLGTGTGRPAPPTRSLGAAHPGSCTPAGPQVEEKHQGPGRVAET